MTERHVNALLLNDIHVGAVRSAGTTLGTRAEIQQYILDSVKEILDTYSDLDLIVNGDLFDSYEVDTGQVLKLYLIVHAWMMEHTDRLIDLGMGNHDIAKNSVRTSSFALFCKLLQTAFPDRVFVHNTGLEQIGFGVWIIPHCVNQDSFDIELQRTIDEVETPGYLLLHANYNNKFAVEADHSLNVSEEWARKLIKAGWTLVFAHEHQRRNAMAGQVIITGNQWPTSVSDCLAQGEAQKDGKKFAHIIKTVEDFGSEKLEVSIEPTPAPTWEASTGFAAMDWKEIEPSDAQFIRIEGEATSDEAADVIHAISRYRQQSRAWVITNSVKIEGVSGIGEMTALSVENLQKVNVLEALCEQLTKEEADVVRELLGENPVEAAAQSSPEEVA